MYQALTQASASSAERGYEFYTTTTKVRIESKINRESKGGTKAGHLVTFEVPTRADIRHPHQASANTNKPARKDDHVGATTFRPCLPKWLKCLLLLALLEAASFFQMLKAPGPPHNSSFAPVQAIPHWPSSSFGAEMSWPQKHWPAYSVPATAKPRESQNETHASLVILSPLKLDHCGSVRGLTVSRKQPLKLQSEFEDDGDNG